MRGIRDYSAVARWLVLFAFFPFCAYANAGTPLMWAGMFHLFVANALIGWLEGIILAGIFRVHVIKTILLMVAANYFSAWIGLFLGLATEPIISVDLTNAVQYFIFLVCITYVMTVLLEFPFVAFALRRQIGWFKKSVSASFLVQTISYALLAAMYLWVSPVTLYTENRIVPAAVMQTQDATTIYFIGNEDGDAYRIGFPTLSAEKVADLNSINRNDRLFFRRSKEGAKWDLMVLLASEHSDDSRIKLVREAFAVDAELAETQFSEIPPRERDTWNNRGEVRKLGSAKESPWNFHVGFWTGQGMSGKNALTGEEVEIVCETVFGGWAIRNAILLPGDKVVFQLGLDQICLFDPARHEVALLAKGRGPIAVIE